MHRSVRFPRSVLIFEIHKDGRQNLALTLYVKKKKKVEIWAEQYFYKELPTRSCISTRSCLQGAAYLQGSAYPTVGMNEAELLRDIVTSVSTGPQRTRELESKFHFDLSDTHLADFQCICDDEQPLSEANVTSHDNKDSGKIRGDGRKVLDRFSKLFLVTNIITVIKRGPYLPITA